MHYELHVHMESVGSGRFCATITTTRENGMKIQTTVAAQADMIFERVQEAVNNALRPLCNDLQTNLKEMRRKERMNNE